ncbi:lipopolysaccharide biosynthesis protein [Sphingobacterium puteale]|uniref:lipopolysaccharide biosynthesis protein n=1 Tax=Sphingobacterium puteale TaxID=2420510 RepID=UPI003D993D39
MNNSAKRILLNTSFLYGKLIFSAVVTLYSTRILISALGIADFGIYNLIAGVILMLAFINGAMTITTQRYLSYHLGKNDSHTLTKIFNSSVSIHFMISLIIVLVLEVLSIWLLGGFLKIPADKQFEASCCYHMMVVSTFFTVNAVPYDSLINAKEDMRFDAIIGIVETILKLGAAYYITFFSAHKLIAYSAGIVFTTIVIRIAKSLWCRIKYQESSIQMKWLKEGYLFREMLAYATWNLFGSICYVASSQGIAVVLNRFLGVNINGTYAISQQMNSQLQSFSVIISKALNPQIMKSEGIGDRARMTKLSLLSSKSSTLLLLFVVIPLIAEMNGVLQLWLPKIPPATGLFCTIILINAVINQLSTGLKSAVQASGNIKLYQSVVGSTIILIVPITYILLQHGCTVFQVLLAMSSMEVVSLTLRLIICHKVTKIGINRFFTEVIVKIILVSSIAVCTMILLQYCLDFSILRLFLTVMLNAIVMSLSIYLLGINASERTIVNAAIRKIKKKNISLSV